MNALTAIIGGVVLFFVSAGLVYRSFAARLLPPPRRMAARCGCGRDHGIDHSFRFRLFRFLTLPTAGLLFVCALPSHRMRRALLLAEAEVLLISQYSRGLIDESDVYQRTIAIAQELGFNENELPPPPSATQ